MNLFFIFFLSVIGVATFSLFIHSQIQMHVKMIFLSGRDTAHFDAAHISLY